MANTLTKSPIVYYGGKTAILNHILPLIPEHEVYTEVFFGGGTVFFAKKPAKNETINDRLDIVINFYEQLQNNYQDLLFLINQSLVSRTLHNEALKYVRGFKSDCYEITDKLHCAWAFWYLTQVGFMNKLQSGLGFNNASHSEADRFQRKKDAYKNGFYHSRIQHAYIENKDGLSVLKSRNVKKAFHYLDPPYPGADQGHYAGYTWDDFEKLLEWCQNECKGKFLLSNYNSEMLDRYIERNGWIKKEIVHRLKAPRKSGDNKVEVLVRNYKNVCGTLDLFNEQ
ncbi:MAG: DNA adenine methylase [Bacteroidota bacterium]